MSRLVVLPSQDNVNKALGDYIESVLPDGVKAIVGQVNRVPEPKAPDFVVMTPGNRTRLSTNVDTFADALFSGSISGNVMTIDGVFFGTLDVGIAIFGIGVLSGTFINQLGTVNPDGTGTYILNNSQTFAEGKLAGGTEKALQPVNYMMQLDVHGPNSADNVHILSTMLCDPSAFDTFKTYGFDIAPLYAYDPKQVPFINDQKQYEDRWVLEACLQVNQAVIKIPQQFFDQIVIGLIDVDAKYPA